MASEAHLAFLPCPSTSPGPSRSPGCGSAASPSSSSPSPVLLSSPRSSPSSSSSKVVLLIGRPSSALTSGSTGSSSPIRAFNQANAPVRMNFMSLPGSLATTTQRMLDASALSTCLLTNAAVPPKWHVSSFAVLSRLSLCQSWQLHLTSTKSLGV